MQITKVAVIGAGTMGSGIASHLANADVAVDLLDIVATDGDSRSAFAEGAVERQLKANPPGFVHPEKVGHIRTGNLEDHFDRIAEADWIVEAIVERLDIKQDLYRRIDSVRKPGAIVASNTSTIPLRLLVEGMPESFKRDFCITHFFNPVRYMRLLELIGGEHTSPEALDVLDRFCDEVLGKGVVRCKDTPGFLGNRVGVFALQVGLVEAAAQGLTIEEADALVGRPMGIPKTGVFGLYDLIGLDLMQDVVASLVATLAPDDRFHAFAGGIPAVQKLIDAGNKGVKSGAGFYRTSTQDGERVKEAVDLSSGEYRMRTQPVVETAAVGELHGVRAMLELDGAHARFARRFLCHVLSYAASVVPEASDDIVAIDEAMKLGFGWVRGPFELIDQIGTATFKGMLEAEQIPVPPLVEIAGERSLYQVANDAIAHINAEGIYHELDRPAGILRVADVKSLRSRILGNNHASLWDLGDGVLCCEFHSKANALSPESMEVVQQAIDAVPAHGNALVIGSDAPHFSVGFNIEFVLKCARAGDFGTIERGLEEFHATCMNARGAPFPVISVAAGMALGGGYEVVLHSDAAVLHSNTVLGLVEPMVGVVPSGGGCKELLARWTMGDGDDQKAGAAKAYAMIISGTTAGSPEEARPLRLAMPGDRALMNRDRMLSEGKQLALERVSGYVAPAERDIPALGQPARDAMAESLERFNKKGLVTPHDYVVSEHLSWVLSGGDSDGGTIAERALLDLEREAFIALAKTDGTQARIEHMLTTGQALRN